MFLSVVSKRSKPAASAAAISSPLTSRSHPRSIASTTAWPLRAYRSGAGVPLSKSMSISLLGGLRQTRWRVKASRREFDHCHNLFLGQMEPLHNLVDRGSRFQIVENNGNRCPRISEYPCATALAGDVLYGGAL